MVIVAMIEANIINNDKNGLTLDIIGLASHYTKVLVKTVSMHDITVLQRNKMFAMIKDISMFIHGDISDKTKDEVRANLKEDFIDINNYHGLEFSFSNMNKTIAIEFIEYLITLMIKHNIPTREKPIIQYVDDMEKYVYACIMNKRCVICMADAELHHVRAVGIGRNRDTINHIGIPAISLCRKHHTETHTIGAETFMDQYHLVSIKINEEIADLYKLNKEV